jgi:hypothetical protein
LIQFDVPGLQGRTASDCVLDFEAFEGDLMRLDREPAALHDFLNLEPAPRLGKYFENLIAFWLENSPRYEVLARNQQVRDAKRTYGELDLIVRDLESGRVAHWEVAIKFYLQLGPEADLFSWVGPNRRDSLGRKAGHLLEHQAKRAQHPVAREQLQQAGIVVDEAHVFTKGWLFYARPDCQLPETDRDGQGQAAEINVERAPQHLRAWWCHSGEFQKLVERSECDWRQLTKPNWLSDQSSLLEVFEPDDSSELVSLTQEGPTYVVGMQGEHEVERGFVVPGDWARPMDGL